VKARAPLDGLRRRVQDARDEGSCRALLLELRRDQRAGAQALRVLLRRRLAQEIAEARRLALLFARTASLVADGARAVAGVDEVGMGPLAGPVVAAAVILPERPVLPGLDDSKRVEPDDRLRLDGEIRAQAIAIAVAEVWPPDIDRMNILQAGLEAMRRAVLALGVAPDHVLVDARTIPGIAFRQSAIPGGDGSEGPIAAASIVAKVHRDALMERLDLEHPGYGFARHKGYATAEHVAALRRLGPCPLHRRSFAPVAELS
jgi:ribonuclease HII